MSVKLVISSSSSEAPLKTPLSSKRERIMPERIDSRCGICHTAERLDFQQFLAHWRAWRAVKRTACAHQTRHAGDVVQMSGRDASDLRLGYCAKYTVAATRKFAITGVSLLNDNA